MKQRICPICGHLESAGAEYCTECNAKTIEYDDGAGKPGKEKKPKEKPLWGIGIAAALAIVLLVFVNRNLSGSGGDFGLDISGQSSPEQPETEEGPASEAAVSSSADSSPRPGSNPEETIDIEAVLAAYEKYFEENYYEGACNLIYLNEDEIPECIYEYGDMGYGILWYKDGNVIDWTHDLISEYGYGVRRAAYQEKESKVLIQTKYQNTVVAEVYEFSEDNPDQPAQTGYIEYDALDSYLNNLHGFGTFAVSKTESSENVWDAYAALQEMESVPVYDSDDGTVRFIFSIDDKIQEDYERAGDIESPYGSYNSGISDFSFCYPLFIYNDVVCDLNPVENIYGTNEQTIRFTGTEGSELLFCLSRRTDNDTIAGMTEYVYETEFQSLLEAAKLVNSSSEDHGRVIVTGYTSARDKLVYDLVKIEPQYIMQMVVTFPAYTGEEDRNLKGYATECIYRMCGFSGNSQEVRSYEEYCAAVEGAN